MKNNCVNGSRNRRHHLPSFAFKDISSICRHLLPAVFGTFLVVSLLPLAERASTQTAAPASVASAGELAGLWKAKKRFGPDARGPLIIQKDGAAYILLYPFRLRAFHTLLPVADK